MVEVICQVLNYYVKPLNRTEIFYEISNSKTGAKRSENSKAKPKKSKERLAS